LVYKKIINYYINMPIKRYNSYNYPTTGYSNGGIMGSGILVILVQWLIVMQMIIQHIVQQWNSQIYLFYYL